MRVRARDPRRRDGRRSRAVGIVRVEIGVSLFRGSTAALLGVGRELIAGLVVMLLLLAIVEATVVLLSSRVERKSIGVHMALRKRRRIRKGGLGRRKGSEGALSDGVV